MPSAHIVCSTNPPLQREDQGAWNRSILPLDTLMTEIHKRKFEMRRIVLVSSNTEDDIRWCRRARGVIRESLWPNAVLELRQAEKPLEVATIVSQELDISRLRDASLIVDLTLGPKDRSAAIYVAASAFHDVAILYAERTTGGFKHRMVPPMNDFNTWLGRHGVVIRDYAREIAELNIVLEPSGINKTGLALAVADLLLSSAESGGSVPGPRANLLTLMELARDRIWTNVIGRPRPSNGAAEDAELRDRRGDEWHRSAGRASQALWVLRSMFAHGQPDGLKPERNDAVAVLDLLSFLSSRLQSPSSSNVTQVSSKARDLIVALDGDDVGRRFEERLAGCTTPSQIDKLADWSYGIQADLVSHMVTLRDRWDAVFIARTGDGFLARLPSANLDDLSRWFRPTLLDASVTIGIGPTVKDAYLALKLGKARNRGGGLYYSRAKQMEILLWPGNTD